MRIPILITTLVLTACATSRPHEDLKTAESARYDHFKTNVTAQRTLSEKQHAERGAPDVPRRDA